MNPKADRIVMYITLGVLAGSLMLTGYNIKRYPEHIRRLKRREKTMRQLLDLQQHQYNREQVLQVYEQYSSNKRWDPVPVLSQVDPKVQMVSSGMVTPLFEGWVLEEMQVEAGDMMLEKLGRLFDALQQQQPAWSVVSCQVKTDREHRGYGDAVLKIQSIYREE